MRILFLAVYPISASQTMKDMMVMTTDTVNIILYHNFMRPALKKKRTLLKILLLNLHVRKRYVTNVII